MFTNWEDFEVKTSEGKVTARPYKHFGNLEVTDNLSGEGLPVDSSASKTI